MNIMRQLAKFLVELLSCVPIELLYLFLEKIRLRRLRKKLKFCGNNVSLSPGLFVDCPDCLVLEDEVSFGHNVTIMAPGGVTIGRGTMIAAQTCIITVTHNSQALVMRETALVKPVVIGEEVWIGAGAIILPGVTIGDNSIIGAGAVVTCNVPPHNVFVGVPARFMRIRS